MTYRRWTKREEQYLATYYPWRGTQYVADKLGRTYDACARKAMNLGVQFGEPNDYIRLSSLHYSSTLTASFTKKLAERDDVLRVCVSGQQRVYVVPIGWADDVYDVIRDRLSVSREVRGWFRTERVAELFGIGVKTVSHKGGRSWRYLREIERRYVATVRGGRWFWRPEGVLVQAAAYRVERGLPPIAVAV